MHDGAVSGNTSSSSSGGGGGVYVANGTFTMNNGTVSGNTSSYRGGGGVYVANGTFTMHDGAVSGNTSSGGGGGVYVANGTFTMNNGTVSGNTSSFDGGGVCVASNGTFAMHGGTVSDNILSGVHGYGREVLLFGGIFIISGEAWPERVFLYDNTTFIAIGGPLSSGTVPIDLGITSSTPLSNWLDKSVLKLDDSYSTGNLANLKEHFTLGNAKMTESPYTEMPITGHKIDDDGLFVTE
jgi:hypothetical protein